MSGDNGTVKSHIPRSRWDKLSKKEKELARKIGLAPVPREPSEPKGINLPKIAKREPYVLGVWTECRLCNQTTVDVYNMIPGDKPDAPYLKSVIPNGSNTPLPNKIEVRRTFACNLCSTYLPIEHTKQELVNMVVKLARVSGKMGVIALMTKEEQAAVEKLAIDLAAVLTPGGKSEQAIDSRTPKPGRRKPKSWRK